ncbi:sulfite exporter TauE/SafE family protein [Persicirhabdus sediminis]|uniref:Probable membrane transporter protein n=1 Tax=Persicirhabdus sediminis TaxID=454144 RepID=A0A8J7MFF5_9BACT|nr:sulfite exporter TauE/SafE family protein [Persicirhabdus sediminis]MBK1791765.1 sulfite exporter TauE/SafE family protein [Persicirhabdus sediminis]
MPDAYTYWITLACAALCIGISKAGFSGVSLISVFLLANLVGARESVGLALPLLIAADLMVYPAFRKYSSWKNVWKLTWPALIGMAAAYLILQRADNDTMRVLIGIIILLMVVLQLARKLSPVHMDELAMSRSFGTFAAISGGLATVLANAAGPVMQLYLLSRKMPKMELIGTGARFFLFINLLKLPLNSQLDLISQQTLTANLYVLPFIAVGVFGGKALLHKVPQSLFEKLIIAFALFAGLRMCFY